MSNQGIEKGDIISLCSCNQLDAVVPFIASMFLGAKIQILKAGRPDNIDTSSIKDYLVGGGAISTNSLEAIRDMFPGTTVLSGYGQTEVGGIVTMFKPSLEEDLKFILTKGNSAGRPVPGSRYKVVDPETHKTLGPYVPGKFCIESECVMKGYYKLDSSAAWDEDGWLRTGDIVFYDDDLCFYIVDRIKEMLKFQSWHVTPAKIEGVFCPIPEWNKLSLLVYQMKTMAIIPWVSL